MANISRWLANKSQEDEQLYERYGKSLEKSHKGEYVAIGRDGTTILGKTDIEVLEKAINVFGSGNFAFKRIGHHTFGQWLKIR